METQFRPFQEFLAVEIVDQNQLVALADLIQRARSELVLSLQMECSSLAGVKHASRERYERLC